MVDKINLPIDSNATLIITTLTIILGFHLLRVIGMRTRATVEGKQEKNCARSDYGDCYWFLV